jgi:hypothetical protein
MMVTNETQGVERQAAEDCAWSDWERAQATTQNKYHRDLKAANDAWREGGSYADLEAVAQSALARRTKEEEEALAVYRQAMQDLSQ